MNPNQSGQSFADGLSSPNDAQGETPQQRYGNFIEQIITNTLKGQIRSKEQVYQLLVNQLQPGTGEIFERLLGERTNELEDQLAQGTDELKRSKAERQLRAVKTLQGAWTQWETKHQTQLASATAVQAILNAEASERLSVLMRILNPDQTYVYDPQTIQQLAQALQETAATLPSESEAFELRQFATGLRHGLMAFSQLEGSLVSWISAPQQTVGFGATQAVYGPWDSWAKQVSSPLASELFAGQAQNQSAAAIALAQRSLDVSLWVELFVLLRGLQNGLVKWFDQQPYSIQAGRHMAGVTFINFAVILSELSNGFRQSLHLSEQDRRCLSQVCFQITLQILRTFAQRKNFPLYGGVFASFSGAGFRDTIRDLDQPFKEVENTREKGRILTVLGYSQRRIGNSEQAITLHQEALELAQQVGDQPCEIANLTHLSRFSLDQKNFDKALAYAQRALILARQIGERQGEANALAVLGYSEIMLAQQQNRVSPEALEAPLGYLEQGQKLAEKLQDVQNSALCCLGLGIGYVLIEQPGRAKQFLEQALSLAQRIGDPDLLAMGHAYLGHAMYQLNQPELCIYHACLGMYMLEQRHNNDWKRAASLLVILQDQMVGGNFIKLLEQQRSQLIAHIGVDGFDYLPALIQRYRQDYRA